MLTAYSSSATVGGGGPRQMSSMAAVGAAHARSSNTPFATVMGAPTAPANAARSRTIEGHPIAHWFRERFDMHAILV